MTPAWALRQEDLFHDCIVSPDVFNPMMDRLRDFVVPYQHTLETGAGQRNVHLYLQGLLSHLPGKNAEDIATFVDVERQVLQEFVGTASWDHRPLIEVLVTQVVEHLGQPDGIIAFDPSSFPKRGIHSGGVKRQWCGHRGKVDNCQVGVFMGYVCDDDHALLEFRLYLPEEWVGDQLRRQACHVPPEIRYQTRQAQCLDMLDAWRAQVPHSWVTGDDELGRHTGFRQELRERGERYVWRLANSMTRACKQRHFSTHIPCEQNSLWARNPCKPARIHCNGLANNETDPQSLQITPSSVLYPKKRRFRNNSETYTPV